MIKFGTGGWRAIIADEFTKANSRLLSAGLFPVSHKKTEPVVHQNGQDHDEYELGFSPGVKQQGGQHQEDIPALPWQKIVACQRQGKKRE